MVRTSCSAFHSLEDRHHLTSLQCIFLSYTGICTSQNETNDCFIIDGAMTIKVHGQTAHDASSSFYEVVEKTLNDQLTFSSILPESSIVFYISSTEEKNTIRRDDKRPATNITVLVTFVVGGCVFVTIALWVLCWTEERPKKISKTRKSSGGRLGISAASSPYWLERNSTSSSLSFESTVLPSNVIGSISPCSSSISDLSSHQTCDSLESNRSTSSTKLETIKEVEDKNAIDYPFNQSLFNNEYLSFRGEI